ncbi:MAG TPA: hypothetical protein VGN17_11995 [Bryobacteraceae bacterium]|jgi:hypothetical protein
MNHLRAAIVLVSLAASTAFAAVDPGLLTLVPPDAKAMVGVQVAATTSSVFGQYLFSQIPNDPNISKVTTAIGFDPRRDIQELLVTAGDGSSFLILGRGHYQPDKMATAAKLAGAVPSNYRGFEILSGGVNAKVNVGDRPGSLVFLDNSIIAMGDTVSIKALIDRRAGNSVFSGPLAERAKQISATNDIWFASLNPSLGILGGAGAANGQANSAQNPLQNPVQTFLQAAVQASGGIKFSATAVTVNAEVLAKTPQDAQSMIDVLRFGASMIQMNRKQGGAASNAASLLDAATFAASGSVAKVSVALPEQQMEQLFMQTRAGSKVATRQ